MIARPRPRVALAASFVVLASALVAGCSDDGSTSRAADSDTSTLKATSRPTSEVSTNPSPSDDVPTTGSTGLLGSAEPTGKLIQMDGASFRLPPKYRISVKGRLLTSSNRQIDGNLDLLLITTQTNLGVIDTLATNLKNHNAGQIAYLFAPKTLDPVEVDGTKLFHVAGKVNNSQWGEAFGGDTAGFLVDFSFLFDLRGDPAERKQVIEEFLSTIDLTD